MRRHRTKTNLRSVYKVLRMALYVMKSKGLQNMREHCNFTFVFLAHCLWCVCCKSYYSQCCTHTHNVASLLAIFINVSFHACHIMDPTCFARMRIKRGWSTFTFHGGNILLHILPGVLLWCSNSNIIATIHALQATFTYFVWAYWVSSGTFLFDGIYVPMSPSSWYAAQAFGLGAMWTIFSISH